MTRLALVSVCALTLAACTAGSPDASPTAFAPTLAPVTSAPSAPAPSAAAAASATPAAEPSAEPTAVPGSGMCPTDSPLTTRQLVSSDSQCFGGTDLQVRGWLDAPPSIGFEPPAVEPGWMYYPVANAATIWEAPPAGPDDCEVDGEACAWFFPHVDPRSGVTIEGKPRWLVLTGHFDDPAAETCHWVYPDGFPVDSRDNEEAVALCRNGFIVDSIRDAP